MKSVVFYLPLLFLVLAGHLYASDEINDQDLLEQSQYWPPQVIVNKEVTGQTHGNTVSAGKEWIFLRYQEGRCLVDMGHNGIFALAPEDTDLLERMRKNVEERQFPYQGLFTHRYTKSFFSPETLKSYQFGGDLESCESFALFHFEYESGSDSVILISHFIRQYQEKLKEDFDLAILLVPTGNIVAENAVEQYIEDGLNVPTVVPYKRAGVLHSLQHEVEKNGDVVIVDKYGKILGQFFLSDFKAADKAEALFRVFKKILQRNQ